MNTKLAAALSGGAALLLALTGCGDDGSKATEAWAKKVCDQVKPQVAKIQQANQSINEASQQKKSPEEVQRTDSAAFENISAAYESLAQAVDRAGNPPVDNGAKLKKNAVTELNGLAGQYAQLRKTVDKLDTDDQGKFAEGLTGVAEELGRLGKSGDQSLQKLQSGGLGEAMSQQEGCKRASPGTTPDA